MLNWTHVVAIVCAPELEKNAPMDGVSGVKNYCTGFPVCLGFSQRIWSERSDYFASENYGWRNCKADASMDGASLSNMTFVAAGSATSKLPRDAARANPEPQNGVWNTAKGQCCTAGFVSSKWRVISVQLICTPKIWLALSPWYDKDFCIKLVTDRVMWRIKTRFYFE